MKLNLATVLTTLMTVLLAAACAQQPDAPASETSVDAPPALPRIIEANPQESHFDDLWMLTDGGENAEAYFSFAGDKLIFQSTRSPYGCDQIFVLDIDTAQTTLASTGGGRTTCAYYLPGDEWIVYASTHEGGWTAHRCRTTAAAMCGRSIRATISTAPARTVSEISKLTDLDGYDAEATVSPTGDRIVFTSMRDGDLDIYSMNLDGSDVIRLTDSIGYDGGPFYSPDGTKIVYRARHPSDPSEIEDYQALLAEGLIRPSKLEILVMDADGTNKSQITDLGVAAFAPFFHPSGEKIIFSTNYGDPTGREFDLWMVDIDGSNLEQITFTEGFDGFPMWSPDGKTFVFCSNRHNSQPGETNVFVTEWVD